MDATLLATALESAPMGVVLLDRSQCYLFVSDAYAKMNKQSPEGMIGQPVSRYVDQKYYENHVGPKLQQCLAGERVSYQIETLQGGVSRVLTVRYIPCFDEHGEVWGVLNLGLDITDDCRLTTIPSKKIQYWSEVDVDLHSFSYHDANSVQNHMARNERLMALGRAVAMLSHEMRNPLGTLSASLKILQRFLPETDAVTRVFARCKRAMHRCEGVTSSLLDYSKDFPMNPEIMLFDNWLEAFLEDYQVPTSIALEWKADGACEVWLDDEMMRRAMTNLMDNAVRAVQQQPKGEVQSLLLQSEKISQGCVLSLVDSGEGMPSALEGFKAPIVDNSGSFGTGFGLLIARQIIERHGGQLKLGNSEHAGAEVQIFLPASASIS